MKRFLLLAALGLLTMGSSDSFAQSRDLGARRFILDNGAGDRLTLEYAGPGSGTLVFPPGGGSIPASGTVLNSTLRWNGVNWVENSALLADPTGAVINTAGGSDLSISEGGLTRAGSIALNPGTANVLSTDGSLAVTGAGRSGTPTEGFHAGADGFGTTGLEIVEGTGSPYIDFTRNPGNDFDGRLILSGNDNLRVEGTNLDMAGNSFLGASSITGDLITAQLHVNSANGYQVAGAAASGEYLRGNGTHFVSSAIQATDIPAGSANYIQNGVASQTADFNITGDGTIGGDLTVDGLIALPSTTATEGMITQGGIRLLHSYQGTFLGLGAGNLASTSPGASVGVGYSALAGMTTGGGNTAVGYGSMFLTNSGDRNTAAGYLSLELNTTGSNNTAIGAESQVNNSTGFGNSSLGQASLFSNTTGIGNTAIGTSSMTANVTGSNNVAVGIQSMLANNSGASNSALGAGALRFNTSGGNNAAVGYLALSDAQTDNNTAVGVSALASMTTGTQNSALGAFAGVSVPTLNNTTVLGYAAVGTASNQVVLGNALVTEVLTSGNLNAPSASLTRLNTSSGGGDKFAGVITTDDASADAIESFANSQVTATSTVIATLSTDLGATQLLNAVPGAGTITISFSANVPDGSTVSYMIVNP